MLVAWTFARSLQATTDSDALTGTIISGNTFNSWNTVNTTFFIDERAGKYTAVRDTVVESNEVTTALQKAGAKKSTRATKTAALSPGASTVTLDFSNVLIFSSAIGIDLPSVTCAVHSADGFAAAHSTALDSGNGNVVVVTFASALEASAGASSTSVTCSVDQSTRTCAAH